MLAQVFSPFSPTFFIPSHIPSPSSSSSFTRGASCSWSQIATVGIVVTKTRSKTVPFLSRCCPTLPGSGTTLCMRTYRSMDADARCVGHTASELTVPDSPRYETFGQGGLLNVIGKTDPCIHMRYSHCANLSHIHLSRGLRQRPHCYLLISKSKPRYRRNAELTALRNPSQLFVHHQPFLFL